MCCSVASPQASVAHMMYLANQSDPEERAETQQRVRQCDVTLGISSFLVIVIY